MPYTICFDFPESDDPVFAGWAGDTLGIAPTLRTAARWADEDAAQAALDNSYGPTTREFGSVVEVEV